MTPRRAACIGNSISTVSIPFYQPPSPSETGHTVPSRESRNALCRHVAPCRRSRLAFSRSWLNLVSSQPADPTYLISTAQSGTKARPYQRPLPPALCHRPSQGVTRGRSHSRKSQAWTRRTRPSAAAAIDRIVAVLGVVLADSYNTSLSSCVPGNGNPPARDSPSHVE